jgi:choline dehydrogenase
MLGTMLVTRALSLIFLFSSSVSALYSFCFLTLMALANLCSNIHSHKSRATLQDYEYVIVGSGPGGSPLAARLALAGHKVLLIDAGGDFGDDLTVKIPALHPVSQPYSLLTYSPISLPRHKGSISYNLDLYPIRGHLLQRVKTY